MKRITSVWILFSLIMTPVLADNKKDTQNTLAEFQKLNASFEQIKHVAQRELALTETGVQPTHQEQQAQQTEKLNAAVEQLEQEHLGIAEDELPKQDKRKPSDSELRIWCGMLGISVFSTFIGAHLQKQNLKNEVLSPLSQKCDDIDRLGKNLEAAHELKFNQLETKIDQLEAKLAGLEQKGRAAGNEVDEKDRKANAAT